jgi:DNA repair protein RadC
MGKVRPNLTAIPHITERLQFFYYELRQQDREHLLVIYLNSRRQVIDIEIAAIGMLTDMYAAPREVFKGAILANACEIILVYNHPSGHFTPSEADERIIYEMIESGLMLKIPLRDFVIIGDGYFSHYECGAH